MRNALHLGSLYAVRKTQRLSGTTWEKNIEKYLKTTSSLFRDEKNLLIWSNFMGNGSINPSTTRRCFSPQISRPVLPAVARRGVPFTQEAKIAGEFGKI